MNNDILKLAYRLQNCKKFYVFGNALALHLLTSYNGRRSHTLSDDVDLIIVTDKDADKVIKFLESLKIDCEVVLWDFTNSDFVKRVTVFLDKSVDKIQYSRQMLINGTREKSLYLVVTNSISEHSRQDAVTVILVLKTGGVYDHKYVNATAKNVRKHLTYPHEIVCMTDNASGITAVDRVIKLKHNWPKWWGKVEIFRPDVTTNKHCLFIDLDTVCLQNIDFMCKMHGGLYGLRDFYHLDTFQTGLLKWDVSDETSAIYSKFLKEDFSKYKDKGDHVWISQTATKKLFLQDMFPGKICSYKKHIAAISKGMATPSIVCFHGEPRPHTVSTDFIKEEWKYND